MSSPSFLLILPIAFPLQTDTAVLIITTLLQLGLTIAGQNDYCDTITSAKSTIVILLVWINCLLESHHDTHKTIHKIQPYYKVPCHSMTELQETIKYISHVQDTYLQIYTQSSNISFTDMTV